MQTQDFPQLIEQRLSEIERKLGDMDARLCDEVRKTLKIAEIDLPFSLGKARVVLETVMTDIYRHELPDAKPKPLFNMIEALVGQKNLFSEKRANDLNYIRINGNMILHPDEQPDLSMADVEPVMLMVLSLVDWYLTQYVPRKNGVTLGDTSDTPLPDNPYRGLEAFTPEDEALFFGRGETLCELRASVEQQRLVLLLGASGCGKSSLAYAGLIPAMRRAGWLTAYFRPRQQPFVELAHVLAPLLYPDPLERGKQFKQLAPSLENGAADLSFLLKTALEQHKKSHLLLLVDQFEESYQASVSPAFHACLWEAVKNTEHFTLLLTLRADFMGYALADSAFAALLKTYPLFPLESVTAPDSLRAIIEQPAHAKKVKLEPLLLERTVRDVRASQEQVNLPLLEFTLTQLWQKQQDRLLTHQAYSELGGVESALAGHAEKVYERLKQDDAMRRVLVQLVFPGKDTADTKQIVPRSQFAVSDWEMVVTLANERLVVTNRREEMETAELTHESLIRHWTRLKDWLAQDHDFRQWRQELLHDLDNWQTAQQAPDLLLPLSKLAVAEDWQTRRPAELAPVVGFISASRAAQQRLLRQQRQRVMLLSALLALSLAAGGAAAWQWRKAVEQERIAQTQERIAQEQAALATQQKETALCILNQRTFDYVEELEKIPGTKSFLLKLTQHNQQALAHIAELDPDTPQAWRNQAINLLTQGDLWKVLGNTEQAQKTYQQALTLFQQAAAARTPDDADVQRNVSLSYDRLGDLQLQFGNTEQGLKYYQQALDIRLRLAQADPNDAQAQRDLSLSYERLGDLQLQFGNTEQGLKYYQQALDIRLRLAQADPNDAQAQRDLSLSYERLGDLQLQLGNTEQALKYYQQSLDISLLLAQAAPSDAQTQRDLAVSYERFGDVHIKLGNTKTALDYFQKELDIAEARVTAAPKDAEAKNFISVVYERLADLQLQLAKTDEALKLYQQSLDIRLRFAQADPNDARAQRDLSVSLDNLGDLQLQLGKTDEALKLYQQSLDIRLLLAQADPNNANAQRDLSVSFERFADLQLQLGKSDEALKLYQQSLDIRLRLAQADPNDANAQRDLMVSFYKLGSFWAGQGDDEKAATELKKAAEIAQKRAEHDPQDAQAQQEWEVLRGMVE